MKGDTVSRTSPSLLDRLREPSNAAAWAEFVDRYGPRIYRWCLNWKLQDADAQDVTQNVLLKLADKMRVFRYDPNKSFRAWLKTLTNHALSDYLGSRKQGTAGSGDTGVMSFLETVEARQDLLRQLEEEFDGELLAEAMARVQARVAPHTWDAFRLTALEHLSGAAAAERLSMKVALVFLAKSKVQRLLAKEIQKLEGADAASAAAPEESDP